MGKKVFLCFSLIISSGAILAMHDDEESQLHSKAQRVLPMPVAAFPSSQRAVSPMPVSPRRHSSYVVTLDPSSIKIDTGDSNQHDSTDKTTSHDVEEQRHSVHVIVPENTAENAPSTPSHSSSSSGESDSSKDHSNHSKTSENVFEFDFDLPDALSHMQNEELNEVLDDIVHQASISTFGIENRYYSRRLKKALLKDVAHIQRHSQAYSNGIKEPSDHTVPQDKSADIIRHAFFRRAVSKSILPSKVISEEAAQPTSSARLDTGIDSDKLNKEWVLEKLNEHEQKMHAQLRSERIKKYAGLTVSVLSTLGGIAAALITYFTQQKTCSSSS